VLVLLVLVLLMLILLVLQIRWMGREQQQMWWLQNYYRRALHYWAQHQKETWGLSSSHHP
jgi:hypothetical protein